MRLKTIPIFFAFFVMGVADAMGPMSDGVKKAYGLDNVTLTLLSFFVFIAFAVFSVPGGLLAARIGKKNLLLLGLALNTIAVAVPMCWVPPYSVLLACIFVLGIGTTFLQVAGNPIMRDVSDEGAYSRNLSFAQGVKGVGSTISTFMPVIVAFIGLEAIMGKWRAAFPIYFGFMAVTLVAVAVLKVKETKADVPPSIASCVALLKLPVFFLAVLGIFFYVGAEVCMARFLQPTVVGLLDPKFKDVRVGDKDKDKEGNPTALTMYDAKTGKETVDKDPALLKSYDDKDKLAKLLGPTLFFFLLALGRIGGGFLLTLMSPRACFRLSALLGVLGVVALMSDMEVLGFAGALVAAFGFANIWPLLFSITVEERPQCANELSGLMCMAIAGGALVPLVMGKLLDLHYGTLAFIVPAVCFAYLLLLSLKGGRAAAKN